MEDSHKIMELSSNTSPFNVTPSALMASSDLPLTKDSVPAANMSFFTALRGRASGSANDGRIHGSLLPPLNKISRPSFAAGDATSSDKSGNDAGDGGQILCGRNRDPNMDPRKLKRIISNRVSAQKSRLKKVQYVADMERKLKALEAHIAVLSPQVELYKNHQRLLQMEQKRLHQKIFSFSRNKLFTDAEIEENKAEVNRLRQLHLKLQQQQQHTQGQVSGGWEMDFMIQSELGKMVSRQDVAAGNGEGTGEGNGLSPFNLVAQHKMVEYKWMPTPGLRQVTETSSNQLGHHEMPWPN